MSEQSLAEEVIQKRLPPGSVLMADRNFAIFSVAWTAQQSSHQVLFRMTECRARKIAGKILPPINSELRLQWRPSREDRKKHPAIPPDAMIEGRLIVAQVTGEDGKPFVLYLFTTLEEPWRELVDLYGGRWFIETDIRTLKGTLGMQDLKAKTVEMVAKELLLGIAGYNLVRSVQMAAARQANLDPRRLSFSGVQAVVMTAVPRLATITDPTEWAKEYQHVLRWAAQCKLPQRSHRRSYPRTVWGAGAKFPAHAPLNPSSNPDQGKAH